MKYIDGPNPKCTSSHPAPWSVKWLNCMMCGKWENGKRIGECTRETIKQMIERDKMHNSDPETIDSGWGWDFKK